MKKRRLVSDSGRPYHILVDNEFARDLHARLTAARKRIYIQSLAFEADGAGLPIARALEKAAQRGVETKVLIDCHMDRNISDLHPWRAEVAEEARATEAMIQHMRHSGIRVRKTRPRGPFNIFFLNRNHKNLFVVDDACYIGGTRLTDHNFEWHDFMVRIDSADLAESAAEDFLYTFRGGERSCATEGGIITNSHVRRAFYQLLEDAKEEIILSSPYLFDVHLLKSLGRVRPGVRIRILTPKTSNHNIINWIAPYISECLRKRNIEIWHYTRFSHAKFIILDKEKVFFGSSNFGLESLLCKEEIGIVVRNPVFGEEFYRKLFVEQRSILEKYAVHVSRRQYVKGFLISYAMHYGLYFQGKLLRRFAPRLKG